MQMVICPNGGKCGSYKHRVGSLAYKKCVEEKASATRKPAKTLGSAMGRPPSGPPAGALIGETEMNMHKAFSQSPQTYRLKNSPVFDGLSLDDDQIQKYINNPWGVYMTDEQESQLKGNIQDQIGVFLEEAVIDIDELSRDEIDEACKIVSLGIRDVEAANAMAVNTGPRMLVADLADSAYAREKVSAALREATANHEVGSDDWYATLADGYIDHLMKGGELQYNMPREEMRASAMEADRQVIAASLKEAIGENAKWLNDRNLRGISVVWSGSLNDIAPSDEDSDRMDMMVQQPHIVITGAYKDEVGGDIQSTPVRLSGEYRVKVPARTYAKTGWTSGVRDDRTAGFYRLFDYSDNFDQDQYTSRGVYRAKTNN